MLICKYGKNFLTILLSIWILSACTHVSVQQTVITPSIESTQFANIAIASTPDTDKLTIPAFTQTAPLQTKVAPIPSSVNGNNNQLDRAQDTKFAVILISKFYTLIAKDEFVKAYELYYDPTRPYSNDFSAFIKENLYPDVDGIDIVDVKICCMNKLFTADEIVQNFEVSLSFSTKENQISTITKLITLIFSDNRWQIAQIQDLPQNFPPTQPSVTPSIFTLVPTVTQTNPAEVLFTEEEKNVLLGISSISKFYTLVEIGELEDAFNLFFQTSPIKTSLEDFIAVNQSYPIETLDITKIDVCCEQSLSNDLQMQKFYVTLHISKRNRVQFDNQIEPPPNDFAVFVTLILADSRWQIYDKATSSQ